MSVTSLVDALFNVVTLQTSPALIFACVVRCSNKYLQFVASRKGVMATIQSSGLQSKTGATSPLL